MGLTNTDFVLRKDLADILEQGLRVDTRAETELGNRYLISATDLGDGSLMDNGLYANPIEGEEMGLPQLAPDLTFPATLLGQNGFANVSAIDASAGLTTALSLSGKFAINLLTFNSLSSEVITVKLTIDGVVIWNDSSTANINLQLLGSNTRADANVPESITCNTSLLLEVQTTTDTSIGLSYLARPIL